MSDIIYSSRFAPSGTKNVYEKYFAIPVSLIKVLLTTSEKPELNHFERAVLSLLINDYYSIGQLSEILLLKNDLVELITNDLKKKGLIDDNYKVTENGENQLKNVYKEMKQEICYLLFDHNRGCLLSNYCNNNDLVFSQGRKNESSYSFTLDKDAFKEEIPYRYIKINQNDEKYNDDLIKKIVARDIFKKNTDKNLVNVEVVELNKKKYHLITSIITYSDFSGKWIVKNPITMENDDNLYDFIYNFSTDDQVKDLLRSVMQYRINQQDSADVKKKYEIIKGKLFNKRISDLHDDFINPLINVINVLNDSKSKSYNDRIHRNEIIKNSMVNLGDLYEKVLYQAALTSPKRFEFDTLGNDAKDNKIKLINIAKSIGFEVSDNGERLLFANRKSLQRIARDPNKAQLAECISWNVLLATRDNKFYIYNFAKKHPNFINLMYRFKRDYRDENKHSITVEDISPKLYIDLLFELLECAFGYKVDQKVLNELINFNGTICDYSFSEELLRTELGNKIFNSSNKELTQMKFNLVSMYDLYITENSKFLSFGYPILENTIKLLVNSIKEKYKCKYKDFNQLFSSNVEMENYLIGLGFEMAAEERIGNNVIDSLAVDINAISNVEKGFTDNFNNATLRVKLLALIDMLKQNDRIADEFINNGLKDLFVITSTLSFLQRHQQVHTFNNEQAKIITDGIVKIVDFAVNKSDLIKW
ncbi:hypothetical protein EI71_00730 [Anaeroplasma bactoclasticum]|jgi:hypothetical protein|uniref:Uncharacterized protein n=1 Tax=Anaeroplasma bactoclasticum TaxID=2088 RepID=A0A397S1X2_9MOLU|nr:hypothetical protein [Anaeroplasma bactoclasticum]RIA77947.1 hypothetical protein EI71_00730 [Anaeroplasma bactoclasticum]